MENHYKAPESDLSVEATVVNNSGMGEDTFPEGVKGWCWGGFTLSWIWGIGNKTWIALAALIPYIGFVMAIVLGVKGREWAWKNKRWDSVEHFNRVQRKWSIWGGIFVLGGFLMVVLAFALPVIFG